MSILIDDGSRVLVQGITGREGQFHTERMIRYGTRVVGGGSLSGEHGGGCLKDVGKQLGADELEAMRAVRRLFDPQGILNPGKGY